MSRTCKEISVTLNQTEMRNELEEIQLIEHYLQGKLSDKHKSLFEAKMQSDPGFKASVDKQRLVLEGIEQVALKQEIKTAKSKFKKFKLMKFAGVSLIVIAAVAIGVIALNKFVKTDENGKTFYDHAHLYK